MNKNNQDRYFTGKLLVAMPTMQDPRFREAVILICGHDKQGAMGLIINKPLNSVKITEVLKQLGLTFSNDALSEHAIFYGGPVEIGRGFILHTAEYEHESSVYVTEDISMSSTAQVIQDFLDDKGPENFLLALGYSGWSAGQLENEIKDNGWLVLPATTQQLFEKDKQHLWKSVLENNGIRIDSLSSHFGNA